MTGEEGSKGRARRAERRVGVKKPVARRRVIRMLALFMSSHDVPPGKLTALPDLPIRPP